MATYLGSLVQIEQTDANGVLTGIDATTLANGIIGNVTGNFTGNIIGGVTAAGSNGQIQFNNNNVISASSGLSYNASSNTFTFGTSNLVAPVGPGNYTVLNTSGNTEFRANVPSMLVGPINANGNVVNNATSLRLISDNTSNGSAVIAAYSPNIDDITLILRASSQVSNNQGTVSIPGNLNVQDQFYNLGNTFLGAVSTVNITGGSNGQFLQTNGSGNLNWSANASFVDSNAGGTFSTYRNLTIARGSTVQNNVDEFITVGGNNYGNGSTPTVIGFNSANSTFAGIRISKAGTERWYIGTDSSSTTGNLIVNAGSATVTQPIRVNGSTGAVMENKGYALYNLPSFSTSSGVLYQLDAWTASTDTTGLTRVNSNRDFQNQTGRTLQLMVSMQTSWAQNSTGPRTHYFQVSSDNTTQIGSVTLGPSPTGSGTVLNSSALIQLANGASFTCFAEQTSGSALTLGGAVADMPDGQSTRLTIIVL